MSRIRSIHPGLWTDEEFVSLTPLARLFFMGVWNECDDGGVFPWSPLKLKMRILPADNVNATDLLDELLTVGCVMTYEADGKQWGAVRNFCKFQRPKKPTYPNPMPEEVRKFVSFKDTESDTSGEAVGNQLPTSGEIAPQMERRGEEKESNTTLPSRSGRGGAYAFLGKVIKLNAKDLERWRKTYHSIADLEAELSSIDVWWTSQPREKQDKWFHATTSMLNKRHQERSAAIKEGQVRPVMLGP